MQHPEKIIEHLSSEITTQAASVMTFRSRLSFTILIGPFVLLGSFLVATKGELPRISLDFFNGLAAALVCVSYISLGLLGAKLDDNLTRQCDIWREQIEEISRGEPIKLEHFQFPQATKRAYLAFFGFTLLAFVSMSCFLGRLLIKSPG